MLSPLRRLGLAVTLATFVVTPPTAQVPAPSAEPVTIDFFAAGPDGVVFDLRPDDVTLKVNGRSRQVRSLRYVPLPAADPAAPVAPALDLEPPFGTNVPAAGGRWVAIVIDHESIRTGAEKNAISSAIRFIKALGPRDSVSYMRMPRGGVEVNFTTDRQKVVDALRKFVGNAPREESEQDRACRSRLLLHGMRDLLEDVAPLNGPKVIVVVSSGVLSPRRDAQRNQFPGPCEIRSDDYQNVRLAAAQSRAHVVVVQPDNLVIDSLRTTGDPLASRFASTDEDRHGLQSLAGAAAGEFMQVVGPDDSGLVDLAKGTAGYYLATFDPEPSERNAAMHRVEVDVTRDQVRVRARPEVFIPRPEKKTTAASPRDMLQDGLVYRGLPLRVVAYASASEGGKVKILTALEPIERNVKIVSAVYGLIDDSRSKLVIQWTADAQELAAAPIITAGEAAPGPYRLRVAAVDSKGRRGAVEYELMATLTDAKPLTLSAIALGTSADSSFTPKLVFGGDQAAVAYFEAYGVPPTPDSVTVRLEIASSPDDRALSSAVPRVITAARDRRMIIGALPIASLPIGDYVVRAIVSVDGRPVGRVLRTLRKGVGS